jgi:hypothetical protein
MLGIRTEALMLLKRIRTYVHHAAREKMCLFKGILVSVSNLTPLERLLRKKSESGKRSKFCNILKLSKSYSARNHETKNATHHPVLIPMEKNTRGRGCEKNERMMSKRGVVAFWQILQLENDFLRV